MRTNGSFHFDFLVPRRPLSLQTRNRANLRAWKRYVAVEAAKHWSGTPPIQAMGIRLTIIFLCEEAPIDADNIIKPIQDALIGLVYEDDELITDVDSHRRFFSDTLDLTGLPVGLLGAIFAREECVYVRIEPARDLRGYL
jgi:crossover junction endodeoxyribonuclease RusA